ncbi:hypothetical protein [Lentilactobacillus hilgardii]|uniref:hypothetical protein n=1 Tax=Lentilactobacillus hilgardii TaxID=1588 RepID=UPI0021C31ED0|nr:hypothetical protein [Lentilactobacillus hilgardii]MCP9334492.1 hypothetical protein [Lentilactobacillus hilgardii]MCP9351089.1 hypothetical protein [Lentilactobacillus hilgardii]MCP9353926.1 hypothetical protein [Lentilactobacillus hilgardii]
MLNILVSVAVSCLIVPITTYFLNKQSRKVANSESDTLDAISVLKDDIHAADSGLTVISRDIFAFVNNGINLVDDHTRYFSLSKIQLERDWETYGYHFKNEEINNLMKKLLDELNDADESVMRINSAKEAVKCVFYAYERPEVKGLCSLINDERKKLVK